jgi:hypothetical protein
MSYYEYYEFLAIDRPLSDEARTEFSRLSSRAKVTSRSASYVYNYGSFPGQPDDLLQQHCDFFYYMASWGIRLCMKVPDGTVDLQTLAVYQGQDGGIAGREAGPGFVVTFATGEEHYLPEWLEGEGMADTLAPLREEFVRGDNRFLYLGWLYSVHHWFGEDYELGDPEDQASLLESCEPPVPAGMNGLSAAQQALVALVGIDGFLVAAAAEASSELRRSDEALLFGLIPDLSEKERNGFLVEVASGDRSVEVRLRRRLEELLGKTHGQEEATRWPRRTVRTLLTRAQQLRGEEAERKRQNAERERKEAAAQRRQRIIGLAPAAPRLWQKLQDLVEEKTGSAYDEAMEVLLDLRDIASYQRTEEEFSRQVEELAGRFRKRSALVRRLNERNFLNKDWKPSPVPSAGPGLFKKGGD